MKFSIEKLIIIFTIVIVLFQDQLIYVLGFNILSYSDEILVVGLVLVAILKLIIFKRVNKFLLTLMSCSFIFLVIGIVSAYTNSNFYLESLLASSFLSMKFFLIIISGYIIGVEERKVDFLTYCIEVIAKIAVLVAVLNVLFPDIYISLFPWGFTDKRFGIISPSSIFEHPGTYGWFLNVVASFYYVKYLKYKERKNLINFFLYAFFALLSMRAKVILALMITIFTANFYASKKKIKIKSVLISVLIASLFLMVFHEFLIDTFLMYFTSQNGLSARSALNINSIKIVSDYFPIGVGFGKFGSHYSRLFYSEYYYNYSMNNIYGLTPNDTRYVTDTFWPAVLGETGFLGFVFFVICIILIINVLNKKIKMKNNVYAIWAIVVLFQGIVESLGSPTFNTAPQNIIIGLIIVVGITRKMELKETSLFSQK